MENPEKIVSRQRALRETRHPYVEPMTVTRSRVSTLGKLSALDLSMGLLLTCSPAYLLTYSWLTLVIS